MATAKKKKKHLSKAEENRLKRKELWQELLPIVKSFGLWIILVVVVALDYTGSRWFAMAFINLTTYTTYGLAKLMFIPASVVGSGMSMVTTLEVNYKSIVIDNYPMIIELECSAYHAYLAMISLIVFSFWNWKQKLTIGAVIFGLLTIINALRIIILGVIGHKFPQLFDIMHDYIWNILLVIVIWALWELANKFLKKKQNEKIPAE